MRMLLFSVVLSNIHSCRMALRCCTRTRRSVLVCSIYLHAIIGCFFSLILVALVAKLSRVSHRFGTLLLSEVKVLELTRVRLEGETKEKKVLRPRGAVLNAGARSRLLRLYPTLPTTANPLCAFAFPRPPRRPRRWAAGSWP